jgi:hypothetical protein
MAEYNNVTYGDEPRCPTSWSRATDEQPTHTGYNGNAGLDHSATSRTSATEPPS